MTTASPRIALLLIDIQQGFNEPPYTGRSTPNFESNIIKLLGAFRTAKNAHVIHICHHSLSEEFPHHPSRPGVQFMDYAVPQPGEIVRSKNFNSAFVGTDLEDVIRGLGIQRLVVVGLTTGHCVSTSIRMASNLRVVDHPHGGVAPGQSPSGEIIVVSDATAMYTRTYAGKEYDGETLHTTNLATLNDEFCVVRSTEKVLQLLDRADS
ncbi:putative isochorismatase hydrolase [Rosellinia necatrix]|uniref:Putative isochorismatase hydrolase n=1 Tax=Rosellinia necatrix TaxID=77044 RepID=A0A1S7UHK5_ROSNE|nr:putative isochorismatase hydrolase [Rosellinia necatrix]